jgi:hypothetical protein
MSCLANDDDDNYFPSLYNIFSGKTDESLIKLVDGTNTEEKKVDDKKGSSNLYNDIIKEIIHKMTDEQKEYIKGVYNE